LIACANVANLLLLRAASRRRETEVRLALGASRWRLIRQALVESGLLALGGGAGGLLLTVWARSLIGVFRPAVGLPVGLGLQVPVDFRVLGFSLVASAVTGLAFGLLPALHASRPSSRALAQGTHAAGGRRGGRGRSVLVVSQVAVSAVLLVSAGLLLRSLVNSSDLNAGFEADNIVVVSAEASMLAHDEARTRELWTSCETGLRRCRRPVGSRWVYLFRSAVAPISLPSRSPMPPIPTVPGIPSTTTSLRRATSISWGYPWCAGEISWSAIGVHRRRSRWSTKPWRLASGPAGRPWADGCGSAIERAESSLLRSSG